MTDLSKIKDRIAKLLRMAADSSSPEEAAIAAGRARKMMDKHNIEMFDPNEDCLEFGTFKTKGWKKIPNWTQGIAVGIAKLNSLIVSSEEFLPVDNPGVYRRVVFRGESSDIMMAEYLFNMLKDTCAKQRKAFFKSIGEKNRTCGLSHNFETGFSQEVGSRMQEMAEARIKGASDGAGLVVIGQRLSKVEEHFDREQKFVEIKDRKTSEAAALAERAGRIAGKKANINRPIGDAREKSGTKLLA